MKTILIHLARSDCKHFQKYEEWNVEDNVIRFSDSLKALTECYFVRDQKNYNN